MPDIRVAWLLALIMTPLSRCSTTFSRHLYRITRTRPCSNEFFDSATTNSSRNITGTTASPHVYLAVGSNLGDRYQNIVDGIKKLCNSSNLDDIRLVKTSRFIETAPMYVTDQPSFLNGVIEIETDLAPKELLRRIKMVEQDLGRDIQCGERNGPRPIDLDILFYRVNQDSIEEPCLVVKDDEELVIPHPRLSEREFVLEPLVDIGASNLIHPILNQTVGQLFRNLLQEKQTSEAVAVLPLPRGRMLYLNETLVMGILNVTPDSFSDGGLYSGKSAVQQAIQMVKDGASIIDVGGESTRPGSKETDIEEELRRTIPVISGIREHSDIPISIDTRHAVVARAAVEAGADVVNDVSGGTFDSDMLTTVAELGVPIVLMHMRGTPETMQQLTDYNDIVQEVALALQERSQAAQEAGIHRWVQVLDPGIGFSKDLTGNLLLLKHFGKLQSMVGNLPMLLGTSRKGFIGKLTGETVPSQRDFGTVASCVAAICLSAGNEHCKNTLLRVHNVKGVKQATIIMDAIRHVQGQQVG